MRKLKGLILMLLISFSLFGFTACQGESGNHPATYEQITPQQAKTIMDTKQDYITIVDQNGEDKLNINNYIGRKNLEKTTEYKNIEINVLSKDTYMDYEIYNLNISNNSENTILLDTGESTKSIYLLDSKDVKYYFYSNEIVQNRLLVQSKYNNTIQIKFSNSYSSSRNIKYLVFSKLILNYDEYKKLDDKSSYIDSYEFRVNV